MRQQIRNILDLSYSPRGLNLAADHVVWSQCRCVFLALSTQQEVGVAKLLSTVLLELTLGQHFGEAILSGLLVLATLGDGTIVIEKFSYNQVAAFV